MQGVRGKPSQTAPSVISDNPAKICTTRVNLTTVKIKFDRTSRWSTPAVQRADRESRDSPLCGRCRLTFDEYLNHLVDLGRIWSRPCVSNLVAMPPKSPEGN
ncbi:hypothetical protein M569_17274 [Genlisea aurea]|uniref:Uncharacterized protein n=1 Tax=Genlisea aurea TaxID=192259 RepID=S8BT21_9LAMI|nr:hypothetical protein M569_17274 [Genlisea aurea]